MKKLAASCNFDYWPRQLCHRHGHLLPTWRSKPGPRRYYRWRRSTVGPDFYIGANGGWGWSSFDTAAVPDPNGAFIAEGDLAGPTFFNTRANGAIFGGQIGYNWQIGNWVLGVEGDVDAASFSGTQNLIGGSPNSPGVGATNAVSATQRIDWLATIRPRIGYLWGPGLLYFTGGGAWEGVKRDLLVNVFAGDTASFQLQ